MKARDIIAAGETLQLLPHKALYWPRERTVVVADIHFGKAAAFRALGVPVPHGTTSDNLRVLDAILRDYPTDQIVFLGDFLHARAAHAAATLAAMLEWRARHPALALTLVRGNHDKHAGDPAAALGIRLVDEPWSMGPFALCHHPDRESSAYVLAGHVHPACRISSRIDSVRLPCFVVGVKRMILPSFGAFTGGHVIRPEAGDALYAVGEEAVHPIR
jgi:DNA ligase-associated metallophosphoesterase